MTDTPIEDAVFEFGARMMAEGRRSLAGSDDGAEFSLPELLSSWEGWVSELERGVLWVEEEFEVACRSRDDLDDVLRRTVPSRDRSLLVEFVDRIDQRFDRATVVEQSRTIQSGGWWWARVPRRTDQRLFLHGDWERDP